MPRINLFREELRDTLASAAAEPVLRFNLNEPPREYMREEETRCRAASLDHASAVIYGLAIYFRCSPGAIG